MLYFENDYCEGAHPAILQKLTETNFEKVSGYGTDPYCASAREKIRAACACPEADVQFISGGTQSNAIVIASMLQRWQGVVAAATGHVAGHEAGAIEYTGHKVITLPQHNGKLDAAELRALVSTFYADDNHDHMVFPGMVYISHPTEYGTLYTKAELQALHDVCQTYHMPLFVDGARLGYGLAAEGTDVTLPDLAQLADVFYIGGTKVGALCGEAVVFPHGAPAHFMTMVKQQGALLAKGRLLGLQFDVLFTDDLYQTISRNAIDTANANALAIVPALGCVPGEIRDYLHKRCGYKPVGARASKAPSLGNTCTSCDALQGSRYLFEEPSSPFALTAINKLPALEFIRVEVAGVFGVPATRTNFDQALFTWARDHHAEFHKQLGEGIYL